MSTQLSKAVALRSTSTRGHASVIIDGIFKFKNREPVTEKQLRYMKYLGHPNPFGIAMTKRVAGRWIQARKAELKAQAR